MWKIERDISPAILPSQSILFPEVLCIFPWMSYTYTHPYSFTCLSFFLFNTSIHHCSEISFFQLMYLSTCQHKPYTLVFRLRDIPVIKIYHHLFLVPCWQFRLFRAFSSCKCMMLRHPCLHSVYLCTLVWFYL